MPHLVHEKGDESATTTVEEEGESGIEGAERANNNVARDRKKRSRRKARKLKQPDSDIVERPSLNQPISTPSTGTASATVEIERGNGVEGSEQTNYGGGDNRLSGGDARAFRKARKLKQPDSDIVARPSLNQPISTLSAETASATVDMDRRNGVEGSEQTNDGAGDNTRSLGDARAFRKARKLKQPDSDIITRPSLTQPMSVISTKTPETTQMSAISTNTPETTQTHRERRTFPSEEFYFEPDESEILYPGAVQVNGRMMASAQTPEASNEITVSPLVDNATLSSPALLKAELVSNVGEATVVQNIDESQRAMKKMLTRVTCIALLALGGLTAVVIILVSGSDSPQAVAESETGLSLKTLASTFPTAAPSISEVISISESSPSPSPTTAPQTATPSGISPKASHEPTQFWSISPTNRPPASSSSGDLPTHLRSPTNSPSLHHSSDPTTAPADFPSTKTPTFNPSPMPSDLPTIKSSFSPSASALPSGTPTTEPSRSAFPTTSVPSLLPSARPTNSPTLHPSAHPSRVPTNSPSEGPSSRPTGVPTLFPSRRPSMFPTEVPSGAPSPQPTDDPTLFPSPHPSAFPTGAPSLLPSNLPTISPSTVPSLLPTISPTAVPSQHPTTSPTLSPISPPALNIHQLGNDLDGELSFDQFGYSLALSSDGSRVAVGSLGCVGVGYARVFEWSERSGWKQVGADLVAEAAGDEFGQHLDISANGNRLVIGGRLNDGNGRDSGHVRIFDWIENANEWQQIGSDLYGEAAGDRFGHFVAISSDGNRVAVGADENDGNGSGAGHARIFELGSGSEWQQVGADIDGAASDDDFGYSVDLSSDGNRVAIGGWKNDGNGSNAGHVRIYDWVEADNEWQQVGTDLVGRKADDRFGVSLSLSSDGNRVAVGAEENSSQGVTSGHVRIFEWTGGPAWRQVGSILQGDAGGDDFGISVALSADGNRVVTGAHSHNDKTGHVRIFDWVQAANEWQQVSSDLEGEATRDRFGFNVAISADGTRVAGGGITNDGNANASGHARVYEILP